MQVVKPTMARAALETAAKAVQEALAALDLEAQAEAPATGIRRGT